MFYERLVKWDIFPRWHTSLRQDKWQRGGESAHGANAVRLKSLFIRKTPHAVCTTDSELYSSPLLYLLC